MAHDHSDHIFHCLAIREHIRRSYASLDVQQRAAAEYIACVDRLVAETAHIIVETKILIRDPESAAEAGAERSGDIMSADV